MNRADRAALRPDMERLLNGLCSQIRQVLGRELVGLYLYGSLVLGDFDEGISDVDLLAATAADIDDRAFGRLQALHADFAKDHPAWEQRIEIAYLSVAGLRTFRTQESRMAVISPGEPFHFKAAGRDWLLNWWQVREFGLVLYGPDPQTLIEPISKQEFRTVVGEHARGWREWVRECRSRKCQAYARLTLCRALYAAQHGEQVSKRRAADWVQARFPEQARLLQEAFEWRRAVDDSGVDHEATRPQTERFVHFMADRVEAVLSHAD